MFVESQVPPALLQQLGHVDQRALDALGAVRLLHQQRVLQSPEHAAVLSAQPNLIVDESALPAQRLQKARAISFFHVKNAGRTAFQFGGIVVAQHAGQRRVDAQDSTVHRGPIETGHAVLEQTAVAGLALFQFLDGPYLLVDVQHRAQDGRPSVVNDASPAHLGPEPTTILAQPPESIADLFHFTGQPAPDVFGGQLAVFFRHNGQHRTSDDLLGCVAEHGGGLRIDHHNAPVLQQVDPGQTRLEQRAVERLGFGQALQLAQVTKNALDQLPATDFEHLAREFDGNPASVGVLHDQSTLPEGAGLDGPAEFFFDRKRQVRPDAAPPDASDTG